MYDVLFQKQDDWSQAGDVSATLKEYAAELDLDGDAFATCLDGGQMSDKVMQDLSIGQQSQLPPAPVFFIFRGQLGSGVVSTDKVQESLEQLLAQ